MWWVKWLGRQIGKLNGFGVSLRVVQWVGIGRKVSFFPLWKPLANFIPLASLLGIKGVYHSLHLAWGPAIFYGQCQKWLTSTVLIKISTQLSPVGSVQDQTSSEGGGHTVGPAREGHLGSAYVRLGMSWTLKAFQKGSGVKAEFCMAALSRNQNIIFLVFFYLLPSAWRGGSTCSPLGTVKSWCRHSTYGGKLHRNTGVRVASRPRN